MLETVCLLAVLSRVHPRFPLVVAANRDEFLERPAGPLGLLRESPPTLGGKDLQAGGTWLAVTGDGVVAGLTNRPGKPDRARKSRGELPLLLSSGPEATPGGEIGAKVYNPCWLLVGDRKRLFYLEVGDAPTRSRELSPGTHLLENRPLDGDSPKVDWVKTKLEGAEREDEEALVDRLKAVLADHTIPPRAREMKRDEIAPGISRPLETEAACVHAGPYGTRSSTIVLVPPQGLPKVLCTDGPPCTSPWREARFPAPRR